MKLKHLLFTFISFLTFAGFHTAEAQKKSVGDATYYSHRLQGRRTSDGSLYHRDSLTCAHRTLPFGTLLKVRNTVNGREVVVKVTDRGPFRRGGIVDLSYAAAERIGLVRRGVVRVEVEAVALRPTVIPPTSIWPTWRKTIFCPSSSCLTPQRENTTP